MNITLNYIKQQFIQAYKNSQTVRNNNKKVNLNNMERCFDVILMVNYINRDGLFFPPYP